MTMVLPAGEGIAGRDLKRRLKRAETGQRLRALALTAPLLLFVLVAFVLPIGLMLFRAVYDPDVARVAPRTVAALAQWDERSQPDEAVYAAMAADLKDAQAHQEVGLLGKRINYELPGSRSNVIATARQVTRLRAGPYKEAMIGIDPLWGGTEVWSILKRAGSPATSFYLLAAIDLHRNAENAIVAVAPDQAIFVDVFLRTFWIATLVTLATAFLGYPVAFMIASLPRRTGNLLLILVLLPFWTSLLVRTTAWVVLLQTNGPINDVLLGLGLVHERLQLIFQRSGTLIAMTHIQLPFTILPIYSVMLTVQPGVTRAARSLGATSFTAFRRIYFPLTLPGVGAGCLLTWILSLGYYITPALVGGPKDQMVSSLVAQYMNRELNWGMASALGGLLLILTLLVYGVYTRLVGVDRVRLG
ncbi:MAG TPA: ABC transporter permease [Stellaceae bacterium]|nr:ABC transporter permease [Stellaceae bacterium]